MSFKVIDRKLQPPTAQTAEPSDPDVGQDEDTWLRLGQSAYRVSTSYVDTNYRKGWEDGIRAFNNQHPSDSKYATPAYDKRSKVYRPKIRSIIRKTESAAAAAFFSNMDVVSIAAGDQTDKAQIASAELMKEIVQYRLTRTIPWFQIVMGGIQDAQTTGAAVAHIYWDTSDKDKPCIDLEPIENFRFDPNANWINPVESSPFWIHCMPMLHMDVVEKQESGEWYNISLASAGTGSSDSTRGARVKDKQDPQDGSARPVKDYDIVWVQRHIHRYRGEDWEFYMLEDGGLLSEPRPLIETVFHGRRPYILGCAILETHKAISSGAPAIARGLSDESNEIANQRLDNVKFVLNKKWFIKRGVDVDLAGLMRNVPGSGIMMNDPEKDVREISYPDVTQSAYEEQNRIDRDLDELLGNFNPAALMTQGAGNAPARNMAMLNQSSGTLVEYTLRTYVETFVQPILRHLILLEQKYETDRVVLGLAAKKIELFQRFDIDTVTDELLNQEITLSVNVGMGATDPGQKLQKFLAAFTAYSSALQKPTPGVNMVEVGKEIFGHLGYADGTRFFTTDNPQITMLQEELQKAQGALQQMQAKLKEKETQHILGYKKTQETNQSKERINMIQQQEENKRSLALHWATIHRAEQDRALKKEEIQAKAKVKTSGK